MDGWHYFWLGLGIVGSAVLALLKVSDVIATGWFLWVSIPLIVGVIIAFIPHGGLGDVIGDFFEGLIRAFD